MRPTKLSSKVFLELPPILAHYVDAERHLWIEGNPKRGKLSMLNRSGNFVDLETLAVERKHLLQTLGLNRARAMLFRSGFEQGRRDAIRHQKTFGENARLALQAALVFGQLQGKFIADPVKFEYDLQAQTLYREIRLTTSAEALIQRMALQNPTESTCWSTAGYLSGHVSEILGRRVLTLESDCMGCGAQACRFISRLDAEFGEEADWMREAMRPAAIEEELRERDELLHGAQEAAKRAQASLSGLSRRLRPEIVMDTVIAESDAMEPVMNRARQLMDSDASAILTGESGTGKETLARAVHYGSSRKKKPFVLLDCVGLPERLLTQELLGYEKGALPGTAQSHIGAFQRANGGTLYINEITRMPLELQGQLLRLIAEGKVTPIGAEKPVKSAVRIVAGTQRDPQEAVSEGSLREDLFYTLSVTRIDIPPLRERETDILRLAELFLSEFKQRHERPNVEMSPEFKQALLECAWPGNVRQLRNVIEHAVIMAREGILHARDLPDEILASRWTRQPQELTEEVIRATLNRTHDNRSKAAELLGVGRTTLWRAMKRLGME